MLRTDSLLRITRRAIFVLAALLSAVSVASLASRAKSRADLAALLDRYAAADQTAEDADDPKSEAKGKPPRTRPGSDKPGGNPSAKDKSPAQQQVERICKRHVFSHDPPKQRFALYGVLGDEAYFDGQGKGHKVGQSYKGAKIKRIGADFVELEHEGKPLKLYVFGPGGGRGAPRPPGPPAGAGAIRRVPAPGAAGMPARVRLPPRMTERIMSIRRSTVRQGPQTMPAKVILRIESHRE